MSGGTPTSSPTSTRSAAWSAPAIPACAGSCSATAWAARSRSPTPSTTRKTSQASCSRHRPCRPHPCRAPSGRSRPDARAGRAEGLRRAVVDLATISRDEAVVTHYRTDALVHQGHPTIALSLALARADDAAPHRVRDLRLPLLVQHGTADRICHPDGEPCPGEVGGLGRSDRPLVRRALARDLPRAGARSSRSRTCATGWRRGCLSSCPDISDVVRPLGRDWARSPGLWSHVLMLAVVLGEIWGNPPCRPLRSVLLLELTFRVPLVHTSTSRSPPCAAARPSRCPSPGPRRRPHPAGARRPRRAHPWHRRAGPHRRPRGRPRSRSTAGTGASTPTRSSTSG